MLKMLRQVSVNDWIQNHGRRLKFLQRFQARLALFKEIQNEAIRLEARDKIDPIFKDLILEYLGLLRDRLRKLDSEPIKLDVIDQIHHFEETKKLLPRELEGH